VLPIVRLDPVRFDAVTLEPMILAMEVRDDVTEPPYPTVMRWPAIVPVDSVCATRGPVTVRFEL